MSLELHDARSVRQWMHVAGESQAAFVDCDGNHVLVQKDRWGEYGLVDPNSHISFKFLNRCTGIWPLIPLDRQVELVPGSTWEYGVIGPTGRIVNNGEYQHLQTHRRRPAGEWQPIPDDEIATERQVER